MPEETPIPSPKNGFARKGPNGELERPVEAFVSQGGLLNLQYPLQPGEVGNVSTAGEPDEATLQAIRDLGIPFEDKRGQPLM